MTEASRRSQLGLDDVFGPEGRLAGAFEGYQPRAGQRRMAELIRDSINDQHTLVLEAGTGVGKTFGYLAPVLLSGKRALISTGTKHLQDQLFDRDLPRLRDLLGVKAKVALLKGRANYLCKYRLELADEQARLPRRDDARALARIRDWATRTIDGDRADCAGVGDDHEIWPLVTSTNDNCLGRECPLYDECFVVKAREKAQKADIVVINHHLFCADLALRQTGFAELLPETDVVVLDEAHQVPEIASMFFGEAIGSRQLRDLAADTRAEQKHEARDQPGLAEAADTLKASTDPVLEALARIDNERLPWAELADEGSVTEALDRLGDALDGLVKELEIAAPRGKGLQALLGRAQGLRDELTAFREGKAETQGHAVRWVERRTRSFTLHTTPVNAAGQLKSHVESAPRAWIMTSATLAAGSDFSHFTRRMNLDDARCEQVESPFDFPNQAVLYLPPNLPEPVGPGGAREHTLASLRAVYPLLKASGGRAFLLFTSHRALKLAAETLGEHLTELPLFVQGTQAKSALLEAFREAGNGVLLGTQSFWEGVDVRGEALSLVMIDRIPFAAPGDPVRAAREQRLKDKGLVPFMHMALPEAIITLKQGVGRLIRDTADTGVMVLCDPRLQSKGYGRTILDALPPMRRTRDGRVARDMLLRPVKPPIKDPSATPTESLAEGSENTI
ncbi:ATP-dependent DNA helicase [Guyparkeria sp. TX1]|uniref:ATP-dependent DNA helicase n=1 Tax=Guyparkeria sp. TX1 TaxID=3115001 RepID=UPI00397782A3